MNVHWPSLVTTQSRELAMDWWVFTLVGLAVAIVVIALIVFPVVRWRRTGNDVLPPQFRRNDKLEITYTLIPIAMVSALFVLTYRVEADVERVGSKPDTTIAVTGYRWSWRFAYPGTSVVVAGTPAAPPELVMPIDRTTRFDVTSVDVNHAFWIPDFLFKRDAIPGMHNVFEVRPTKLGVFPGRCGEFCGLEHAHMSFTVRVVNGSNYDRWLQSGGTSIR